MLSPLLQVAFIFGLSRLWGLILFITVGRQETYSPWGTSDEGLDYLSFISIWDAGWYQTIAQEGYPHTLPTDTNGTVTENPWAFYPLFPYLAKALTWLGLGYFQAASLLATLSGFCAAYIIYLLFRQSLVFANRHKDAVSPQHQQSQLALWGVAAFSFMPVAPVLQVPYAESLNLIFLAGTLLLLLKQKWWGAVLVGLFACLSRPVGVPLGATAGLWWAWTVWQQARLTQKETGGLLSALLRAVPTSMGQLLAALALCAEALLWPLFAWLGTGRIDAYTATETAWRGEHLAPIMPWISQGQTYFGAFGIPVLLVLVIGYASWMLSRSIRTSLHPVLILWCSMYALYLLIFLNPQSSLFRMLLPLFPLCLALMALSADRAYRSLLVVAGAIGQFGWVGWLWHWKQLPGGGDYPP